MKDRSELLVEEFHRAFGLPVKVRPTMMTREEAKLRIKLMREELAEFEEAVDEFEASTLDDFRGYPEHFSAMASELVDLLYVTYGTALTMGFDAAVALAEVHRANMAKLWTTAEVNASLGTRAAAGRTVTPVGPDEWVVTRADGKILKPLSFRPADVRKAVGL